MTESFAKESRSEKDYARIFAPIVMITAGLFTWAIRGQAGYGAIPGCVFAGTLWGVTWFLFSKEESAVKSRRYGLGWSVFAFIFGIGISGMQGWGDIVSLIRGELLYNTDPNMVMEVSMAWGLFYVFWLGFHWAGTGSLLLAWTGSKRPIKPKDWIYRFLSMALGALAFFGMLSIFPQIMLPKYSELNGYNFSTYNGLADLYGEIQAALIFSGAVAGGLIYEIIKKDKLNIKMILIPALTTAILWMFLIVLWENVVPAWADDVGLSFNWWRCWESTGGGAIGLGFGIAFVVCNKQLPEDHPEQREQRFTSKPNGERLIGVYGALMVGLVYSTVQSIKGALHIAYPEVEALDSTQLGWFLPVATIFLLIWLILIFKTSQQPYTIKDERDTTAEFGTIYIFTYLLMRELGLQVTYALNFNFSELAFFVYYLILAAIDIILVLLWAVKAHNLKLGPKIRNIFAMMKPTR